MWAVGCILAELLNGGQPILPGRNEIDQFIKICELIGKPQSRHDWPEYFNLPHFETIHKLSSNTQN